MIFACARPIKNFSILLCAAPQISAKKKSGRRKGAVEGAVERQQIEPWAHRTFRLIGRWSTLKLHDDAVIHT